MMELVRSAPYRGAILLSVLDSMGTISGDDWGEKERQKTHFSRLLLCTQLYIGHL